MKFWPISQLLICQRAQAPALTTRECCCRKSRGQSVVYISSSEAANAENKGGENVEGEQPVQREHIIRRWPLSSTPPSRRYNLSTPERCIGAAIQSGLQRYRGSALGNSA